VSSPPPDDRLPQRLRAQAFIRDGEARVARSWFASMRRFLDRVRPAVVRGDAVDQGRISDHQQFWTDEVNVEIVPTIATVLRSAARRVIGREPESDPWTADYLNQVGNRLVRIPDEVYALIVSELEHGLREGESIPDMARRVERVLTATGSERWPNRARTVARTETIGAVNAGVFRAAVLDAQDRGDVAPAKVWIATEDARTRPSHTEADKQRTLLLSPFRVGGADLMFPGDPRGPAQEVINCRCSLLPVVLGEEIDWTDRQRP